MTPDELRFLLRETFNEPRTLRIKERKYIVNSGEERNYDDIYAENSFIVAGVARIFGDLIVGDDGEVVVEEIGEIVVW
ncbi:MAG: hypothetical protein J7J91_05635 [Deltaproteobacteria bacterium]|nr:hypothetical protein [Deltaproteobacteria bacterium]